MVPPLEASPARSEIVRRSGLKSPIDAFAHLFATLPDAEISRRTGVTRGALYQYRVRRRIPAFRASAAKSSESAAPVVASPAPAPLPSVPPPSVPQPDRSRAYTVLVRGPEGERSYVVLGADIRDACNRALRSLGGREVVAVAYHLDALV